jgi:hypothetical protein
MSKDSSTTPEQLANRLADTLLENCSSPTMGYLLQLPQRLWCHTEAGQLLKELCTSLGIKCKAPPHQDFFKALEARASPLEPVHGEFYVMHTRKTEAVRLYSRSLRAKRRQFPEKPYLYLGGAMPYMFQTLHPRPGSKSLFVIASTVEMGLRLAYSVIRLGYTVHCYEIIEVQQIYEMRPDYYWLTETPQGEMQEISGNCVAGLILDWEVMLKDVEDRGVTREELEELADHFGLKFYQEMVEKGHVDRDSMVDIRRKFKSRPIQGGDWKISRHWIFNVYGVPSKDLHHVITRVMGKHQREIKLFCDKATRAEAFVDPETREDTLLRAWYCGFDFAGTTGRGGYAQLGSKKSYDDPDSALTTLTVCSGGSMHVFPRDSGRVNPVDFQPPPAEHRHPGILEHRIAEMELQEAIELMYQASCSAFKPNMVALTEKTREDSERNQSKRDAEERQSRTAARHHASSGAPPPSGGARSSPAPGSFQASLPRSVGAYIAGCKVRRESAKRYLQDILRVQIPVEDPALWDVVHLESKSNMPCIAKLASKENPTKWVHKNNGQILAVHPEFPGAFFARCTTCSCLGDTSPHMKRMESPFGVLSNWFKLTGEGFTLALEDAESKVRQVQSFEKKVDRDVKAVAKRKEVTGKAKELKKESESALKLKAEIEKAKKRKLDYNASMVSEHKRIIFKIKNAISCNLFKNVQVCHVCSKK